MTKLVVLGLLAIQPMSGYQIKRYLEVSQSDVWAGILPGSIYHALKQLTKDGLVELLSTEQIGHRARAIYRITEQGQAAFQDMLRAAWSTASPAFPANLYCALNFIDFLPREELVQAIERQIAGLEQTLQVWDAGAEAKRDAMGELPPVVLASLENGRQHLQIDLKFLLYLLDTVPTMPRLAFSISMEKEDEEQ